MPYHKVESASPETLCFLRQAAFVVVWNGSHPFGTWVMNMRRRLNLPVASVQRGFIDGDNHLMFDRGGCGLDSELVRSEDFESTFPGDVMAFRQAFPVNKSFDDPRTLIVGECRTNASILGFSQFIDEHEYFSFCVDKCGIANVVYRPPIGNEGFREMLKVCEQFNVGFSNPEDESWSDCLDRYSSAIGSCSNRLVDFAVRGKPVVSLGESLVRFTEEEGQTYGIDPDLVYAESWKRQFGMDASPVEICGRLSEVEGFEALET